MGELDALPIVDFRLEVGDGVIVPLEDVEVDDDPGLFDGIAPVEDDAFGLEVANGIDVPVEHGTED